MDISYWLVVSNIFYFPFHIWVVILNPLTNSYFSRWLLHHQPDPHCIDDLCLDMRHIYIISWIIMEENPNIWPFKKDNDLVGGLEHGFYVSIQLGIIITPTDYIIFFRGVGTPPTSIWWLIFLWDLLSNKTIYQSVPRPEEGEPPENPATVFQAATVFRDICRLANEKMTCKYMYIYINLVGGLEHFLFFHILGIIIPTDSYFSEGLKPPTIYIYTHMILYNPMDG